MDKIMKADLIPADPLNFLKEFTSARIAIGSTGDSIPTKQSLEFKLAHAHARDAVYSNMATDDLEDELLQFHRPVLQLHSQAANRAQYLQRPDLGRLPDELSMNRLADQITGDDLVIIIADGLSAMAMNENVMSLLKTLVPKLLAANLKIGPFCLVQQGRVAIGDHIAHELEARLSLVLIGERPGLSAADSIGAYLTYLPRPGLKDNSRNCISNIRPGGLGFGRAADKIFYLIQEAFKRKLSGVGLKDNEGLLGE
jgi:ethanolamine ammonia-lyase small subunit